MTFLEALYGSQYQELKDRGTDPAKGRLNSNVFLTAFIIVIILVVLMSIMSFSDYYNSTWNAAAESLAGDISGKQFGEALAIPVFALIYFVVLKTVGTAANYERLTNNFMQYPDDIKSKANKKLLVPFFVLLAILLVEAIS